MKITFYGHACVEIESNGTKLLFDPFISPNPLASHIDMDALKADYILISHAHQDHIADVEAIYANTNAKIVSNFEIVSWFQNKGLENAHPMNHGGKWQFDFGTVKMVNAVHTSSFPDGSYGGNPAGFVVKLADSTFYFAGDTALHQDMKQIGEEFAIDVAILPIGDNFTMGIDDAVKCADYVGTDKIFGVHYDTFPYIEIDQSNAKKVAEKGNKELLLVEIGETLNI
ncbi:metal-dependent hydrolase [Fulvivirgaceae bacterium BMA10]|uniref:UPF0173 metal-dependent hydrolase QQ008_17865 n=1 Tax=Splendidivirga corallicola TaxID=3051826 RepID=A0ABT8KR74_9BACT|nr:metal-dependent hydrolase [Fulvivirgaceae bacterium BMA10]